MLRQLASLLILVFTLTCLSGCSRELSRARTKSLIAEESNFRPNAVTIEFITGNFITFAPEVLALEKEGLVKLTNRKRECGYFSEPNAVCGDVALTEKGIEVSRGWVRTNTTSTLGTRTYVKYTIPVASRVVKEIDGIREEPMVGTVAVFNWGCQLNDLGQKLQPDFSRPSPYLTACPPGNSLKKSSAVFKRYDDGWRLENISW